LACAAIAPASVAVLGADDSGRCPPKIALAMILQSDIIQFMSGITFMVDSHGKKTAAVIDLRRHRRLWEDFYDTVLAESRAHEPRESLDFVKRRLKLAKARG
jgi:hypothetical protein